jgi:hypothetical protein
VPDVGHENLIPIGQQSPATGQQVRTTKVRSRDPIPVFSRSGRKRVDKRSTKPATPAVSFYGITEGTTEGKRNLRVRCVEREVVQPD